MSIARFIPTFLRKRLSSARLQYRISKVKANHQKALSKIQQKDVIKIAFLVIYESMWKYERLYFLLKEDPRFEPVVFICPFKTYGKDIMQKEMETSFQYFNQNGYDVQKTSLPDGQFLAIKETFQPDIVFFTNPWDHTRSEYLIQNFLDTLTCYVPYGFNSSNLYKVHYQMAMQNYCWKYFIETNFHQELAREYSPRKGDNTVVTGYPGVDNLLADNYQAKSPWKKQKHEKKKIIWAPHHTIPQYKRALDYSTFLNYSTFMLEIAHKYADTIQFCFKPHPNLRGKLVKLWGKSETDTYYKKWAELENGQINEGEYIDLFATSDALIHDCGSFVFEYFFTNQPTLFLIANKQVKTQFNDLGKEALSVLNLGYSQEDIEDFIQAVVLEGKDIKSEDRKTFKNKLQPNQQLASENIFQHLNQSLNIK